MLRLGKHPATDDDRDLKLAAYLGARLPKVPTTFGHEYTVASNAWQMLGNDEFGDCAFAGPAHETMLWNKVAGRTVTFTTAGVLSDYSAVTGFDPNAGPPGQNPTDRGSNVRDVANYRRHTGIVDAVGHRHKIGGYVALEPGDLVHVEIGAYVFDAVGIGIEFPASAMDQFTAGQPWDVVPGATIEGGHYVPIVGKDAKYLYCVTWGRLQPMTPRFFGRFCDEAFAYLSSEFLSHGKSPEGFALAQLQADLAAL